MERDGSTILPIYDNPPDELFYLISFITQGDVTKHDSAYTMPVYRLYAYADMLLKSNTNSNPDGN